MNIGIIGCGNMGAAIARRIEGKYALGVCDKDPSKLGGIAGEVLPAADLVHKSAIVILAVKPQDFSDLLEPIKKTPGAQNRLFISIAAGITTAYIQQKMPRARVIRAMPNLPAQIGEGMTALSKGALASSEDLGLAVGIFNNLGKTLIINEDMMDAVTAVSGSGPAFVCFFLESKNLSAENVPCALYEEFIARFQEAAEAVGFNSQDAELLVKQTYAGTVSLLKKEGIPPQELRRRVTSKRGTTEAALEVLYSGGSLKEAVESGRKRAQQLSRG
jgi:pyrroline-5-carboxylate reductase